MQNKQCARLSSTCRQHRYQTNIRPTEKRKKKATATNITVTVISCIIIIIIIIIITRDCCNTIDHLMAVRFCAIQPCIFFNFRQVSLPEYAQCTGSKSEHALASDTANYSHVYHINACQR